MIGNQKELFRLTLGAALTDARKRLNMSIAELAKQSGEQHKTIVSIEGGKVCSLHHALWMKSILGINVSEVIDSIEGKQDEKKAIKCRTIDDFL
jgi:predicted transcriptional regulator